MKGRCWRGVFYVRCTAPLADSLGAFELEPLLDSQRWFVLRFNGKDSDINLEVPGHEPEFKSYQWTPLEDAPLVVVPFKRAAYERVVSLTRDAVRDIASKDGGKW